jgi:arginine:ornithine antiporter / lysine permease
MTALSTDDVAPIGALTFFVIGSMIGSGVFSLPQNMAAGAGILDGTVGTTIESGVSAWVFTPAYYSLH